MGQQSDMQGVQTMTQSGEKLPLVPPEVCDLCGRRCWSRIGGRCFLCPERKDDFGSSEAS